MKLFRIINNNPYITEEALCINEFSVIWKRDESPNKEKAIQELAYIYFFIEYTSPYNIYSEDLKKTILNRDIIKIEKYKPEKEILAAIKKYDELQQTPSMEFLKSALVAAKKTQEYFNTIDYTERDEQGKPIFKVGEVSKALKECSGIMDTIEKLSEKVKKEKNISTNIRGGGLQGLYED